MMGDDDSSEEQNNDSEGEADGGGGSKDEVSLDISSDSKVALQQHSWLQLWMHASIMCGREFIYAVQVVIVAPIILQLGLPEKYYSFMWMFSPILGIITGPILGSRSDNCKSRFGRRRPFIVFLVCGSILGLTLLIFNKDIVNLLLGSDTTMSTTSLWCIVIATLGSQLTDYCLDQTETPLRAYTLDVCSLDDQQRAFNLQTAFIGIGGALGFIVDGIDWPTILPPELPFTQTEVVFIIAVVIYLSTTVLNVLSIKEIPLTKSYDKARLNSNVKHKCSFEDSLTDEQNVTERRLQLQTSEQHEKWKSCDEMVPQDLSDNPAIRSNHSIHQHFPQYLNTTFGVRNALFLSLSCPSGLDDINNTTSVSLPSQSTFLTNDGEKFGSGSSSDDTINQFNEEKQDELFTTSYPLLNRRFQQRDVIMTSSQQHRVMSVRHSRSNNVVDVIRTHHQHQHQPFMIKNHKNQISLDNDVICKHRERKSDSQQRSSPNNNSPEQSSHNNVVVLNKDHNQYRTSSDSTDDISVLSPIITSAKVIQFNEEFDDNDEGGLFTAAYPAANNSTFHDDGTAEEELERFTKTTLDDKQQQKPGNNTDKPAAIRHLWQSVVSMPSQLAWLCLVLLLGDVGLEICLMWYTDLFGKVIYMGDPKGAANSTELLNYNTGVQMGCWGLTIYSVAMIVFSVLLEKFHILEKFPIRVLFSAQFIFSVISSTVMFLYPTQTVVYTFSSCIGISYTFTLTVPFVLLGRYHQDIKYHSSSPGYTKRGYGVDCAILSSQMYLANLIAAALSSPIIHSFDSVRIILVMTAVSHLLAFLIACFAITYNIEGKKRGADQ